MVLRLGLDLYNEKRFKIVFVFSIFSFVNLFYIWNVNGYCFSNKTAYNSGNGTF